MGLQDDFDKETDLASDFDNEQDLSVRAPAQTPEAAGGSLETAGDTLRGAAQGATFGLADELAGALGASGEVLTGQTELQNALEAYRRQRDESRAAYKAAEERSPTAFTTGNILGGVATAIPTAGIGAAAKGAGLLGRLGYSGGVGAAGGALAGLGTSEADLTKGDIGGVAVDVASGIGTGAVMGGATQGGMELVKGGAKVGGKVLDALTDTETVQDLVQGYKSPEITLGTAVGRDQIFNNLNKKAKELGISVDQILKDAGTLIGKTKEELFGKEVNLSNQIKTLYSEADNLLSSKVPELKAKGQRLKDYLDDTVLGDKVVSQVDETIPETVTRKGGINPEKTPGQEGLKIKDDLNFMTGVSANESGPLASAGSSTGAIKSVIGDIDKQLIEKSASLAQANKKYTAISQALDYLGLNSDELLVKDAETGLKRLTPGSFDKIIQKLSSAEEATKSGLKAEERLNEFLRLLRFADKESVDAIEPALRKAVKDVDLANKVRNANFFNPATWVRSGSPIIGNIAGKVAQGTSELAKAGTKNLSEATPEQLKQVVNSAMAKGGASMKIVQPLVDAMKKDNVGRNAALFAMQQNPEYREILKDLVGGDENEE